MPFDDLRTYLRKLEEEGELVRVAQEVDWNEEAGAILRRSAELGLQAVRFDRVKDYPGWCLTGGLVATFRRVAIAMDLPSDTPVQTLGAELVHACERSMNAEQVNCVLGAADSTAAMACVTAIGN